MEITELKGKAEQYAKFVQKNITSCVIGLLLLSNVVLFLRTNSSSYAEVSDLWEEQFGEEFFGTKWS